MTRAQIKAKLGLLLVNIHALVFVSTSRTNTVLLNLGTIDTLGQIILFLTFLGGRNISIFSLCVTFS